MFKFKQGFVLYKEVIKMDTVILKFGGSSVANDERLNLVAQRILEFYEKNKNIVVVVSAQGKTTDRLLKEAYALSEKPDNRELDVLLSVGEQITIAKLAILLIQKGYKAISLTGWQAGIQTNNVSQNAIIENIDTGRINYELKNGNIVILAGFQGINNYRRHNNIRKGRVRYYSCSCCSSFKF